MRRTKLSVFSLALLAAAVLPVATANGRGADHEGGRSSGRGSGRGGTPAIAHATGLGAEHADAHVGRPAGIDAAAVHGGAANHADTAAPRRGNNQWNGAQWNGNRWNRNDAWAGWALWGLGNYGAYGYGFPDYYYPPVVAAGVNGNVDDAGYGDPYPPGYRLRRARVDEGAVEPGGVVHKADAGIINGRRFNVAPDANGVDAATRGVGRGDAGREGDGRTDRKRR